MIEGQASGQKTPKLRYGMVGGGQGAFIGDVHRKSIAMDGKAEIVCGAVSPSYDNTLAGGEHLGLPSSGKRASYSASRTLIRATPWSSTSVTSSPGARSARSASSTANIPRSGWGAG